MRRSSTSSRCLAALVCVALLVLGLAGFAQATTITLESAYREVYAVATAYTTSGTPDYRSMAGPGPFNQIAESSAEHTTFIAGMPFQYVTTYSTADQNSSVSLGSSLDIDASGSAWSVAIWDYTPGLSFSGYAKSSLEVHFSINGPANYYVDFTSSGDFNAYLTSGSGDIFNLFSGPGVLSADSYTFYVCAEMPATLAASSGPTYDVSFSVEPCSVPAVPEPTTLLLVGGGLAGLAGLRRKMKG